MGVVDAAGREQRLRGAAAIVGMLVTALVGSALVPGVPDKRCAARVQRAVPGAYIDVDPAERSAVVGLPDLAVAQLVVASGSVGGEHDAVLARIELDLLVAELAGPALVAHWSVVQHAGLA